MSKHGDWILEKIGEAALNVDTTDAAGQPLPDHVIYRAAGQNALAKWIEFAAERFSPVMLASLPKRRGKRGIDTARSRQTM